MDTASIEAVPDFQRAELNKAKQIILREQGLLLHNSLVETCFMDCVKTFRSKKLDKDEEGCVSKCTEKFLKLNKRAGFRFAEINFANSGKKMED
mmetsp:Transcript_28735/g.58749  ORF Transcript_28735/g.58749 Transcript_28735/m.58749 type:complete len:94 (-) Transcript_28735:290-571(-)